MTIFEKRIRKKIARAVGADDENRIIITDYMDIDFPVYYEIKLERLN